MAKGYKRETLVATIKVTENGYQWDTFRYVDSVPVPVANLRLILESDSLKPKRWSEIADTKAVLKQQLGSFIDTYFNINAPLPGDPENLSEDP